MNDLKSVYKWRFFKTKKEKDFIIKNIKKGKLIPLGIYVCYLLGATRFVKVERNYYKLYLSRDPYALWLYFHPKKERKEEEFVYEFLKEGNNFVDCGAHLGTVSFTASYKVGVRGKVISIEAHPDTFRYLKRNNELQKYENTIFINAGVGEREGFSYISTSYVSDMNHIGASGREVKMITLEPLIQKMGKVDLLKLDVEGMELVALRGAGEGLTLVDAIIFESSESLYERNGYSLQEMFHFLTMRGYEVFRFVGDSVFCMEKIDYLYRTKKRYEDLVAVKGAGKIRLQMMLKNRQPF